MQSTMYFGMSAAAGLIAWFTIFATLIWPKMKAQSKAQILRTLTAIHFFRYFGTAFLITGLVVHKLPTSFANPAAFGDLVALVLAYIAFISLGAARAKKSNFLFVWLFNVVGTADLLFAAVKGPMLIHDTGDFGLTYLIPTLYVPLLFAAHFYAFKVLARSSDK